MTVHEEQCGDNQQYQMAFHDVFDATIGAEELHYTAFPASRSRKIKEGEQRTFKEQQPKEDEVYDLHQLFVRYIQLPH